jgi:hypothetical protein
MEGITLGIVIGAGAVMLAKNGRKRVKSAIGWAARQSGWVVARVRADVATAHRVAREEFERERTGNPPPAVDVVVPSERVHANGTTHHPS